MTKFEELSLLAGESTRATFAEKDLLQKRAREITNGYAEYLGCDLTPFEYVDLDSNLNLTDTHMQATMPPPMFRGRDRSWNFAFSIKFKDGNASMQQTISIALFLNGDDLTLKSDRTFNYSAGALDFEDFYDYLYSETVESFKYGGSPREIGFHAESQP